MATHFSVLAWRIPGTGILVGCRLWGRTESDMTKVTQHHQQQQQQALLRSHGSFEVVLLLPAAAPGLRHGVAPLGCRP